MTGRWSEDTLKEQEALSLTRKRGGEEGCHEIRLPRKAGVRSEGRMLSHGQGNTPGVILWAETQRVAQGPGSVSCNGYYY